MSKMLELLKHLKYENQHSRLENIDIKIDEQKRETDYIKLVNHNKPKDISFNDQIDKPFNPSELNTKLNEIINARSYDSPNSILNKPNDKKVAFSSKIETIEETTENNEKIYTLLQTIATDLKISINKQDLIIEMLNKEKEK